jgi:hypothetical protein
MIGIVVTAYYPEWSTAIEHAVAWARKLTGDSAAIQALLAGLGQQLVAEYDRVIGPKN